LLGAASIRVAFDAMFANGGAIAVRPEHMSRVDALASAVHPVLERVHTTTAQGRGTRLYTGHQRVPQDRSRLAYGGGPCPPWRSRGFGPILACAQRAALMAR
jgi:hypothetical protein